MPSSSGQGEVARRYVSNDVLLSGRNLTKLNANQRTLPAAREMTGTHSLDFTDIIVDSDKLRVTSSSQQNVLLLCF